MSSTSRLLLLAEAYISCTCPGTAIGPGTPLRYPSVRGG